MSRLGVLIAAVLVMAGQARAQTSPVSPPPSASASSTVASLSANVDRAQEALRAVRVAARAKTVDDATLKTQIAAIPAIQAELSNSLEDLEQRLDNINQRLTQVGPAPAAPQTEAPEITESRAALTRQHQLVDAEVKQARLLGVEADQLSTSLTERRRQMFSEQLWAPSRSLLSPSLWGEFIESAPKDFAHLRRVVEDEAGRFAAAAGKPGAVVLWLIGAFAAIVLVGPVRILLARFGYHRAAAPGEGSRLRRSGLALWLALTAALTPLVAGLILRGVLLDAGALTEPFDRFAQLCIRLLVFAMLYEGLGRALLSPGRPTWRLAPIPDDVVVRLAPYPGLVALTAALASLVAGANQTFGASLPTAVASDCITLVLELAAVAGGLAMLSRARHGHVDAEVAEQEAGSRLPWILAALTAWLTVAGAVLAVLFGYLALASFLAREMIWISLVLAALFLLVRFFDDLFPVLLAPERSVGRFARIAIGLSSAALEQIAVLLSGLFRLALFLFGWVAVLAPFGASTSDLYRPLTASSLEIKLGQVSISPGLVLGGVAVFVVGLIITRAVRGWLERRYLPKTRMDVGARTSLSLGVTYLGGLIAALLTCGYLGVSLDKITLVASALSVGIGFGLQAIISNFISGLILLAERPVKVGDWIAIGDMEGDVKRVNVRATEIEMGDRSKLIVPNSDLISKQVRNITHGGSLGLLKLTFLLDNQVEPDKVRDLLLTRLAAHAEVLHEPKPGVYLNDVKGGALEFVAMAYVSTPRNVFRVKSELLYQIIPGLKAAGMAFASAAPSITITARGTDLEVEKSREGVVGGAL